jgi:exonuclease III
MNNPTNNTDVLNYNLATINLNGISNQTKMLSVKNYVRLTDLDIIFFQEVENENIESVSPHKYT